MKYFKQSEFDSPDLPGSGKGMDPAFLELLDRIREEVGFPLIVMSGFRTPEHNRKVGGVSKSAHERGLAADLGAAVSAQKYAIVKAAFKFGVTRIGVGPTFVHLDMDEEKPQCMMWTYSAKRA